MAKKKIGTRILKQIDRAVVQYTDQRDEFERLANAVHVSFSQDPRLIPLIHSTKVRAKDPEHLRDKLMRKANEAIEKGKKFDISEDNLFTKIEDLAGVRLLHLHTKQVSEIHPAILGVIEEFMYKLIGKPVAYTWDIESYEYFKELGLKAIHRKSMYTSIHYILKANRKTDMRCELQVRTLMEEVWGEVSHTINYPHETKSVACQEQLRVLARIASGCSRLVDSIFTSAEEFKSNIED